MICGPHPRARNAATTREAILDAARERFVAESYEDVGLRDIARGAGVDAALVCRYFGGKEELFASVLERCKGVDDILSGSKADFGARMARKLVAEVPDDQALAGLLIMLRSFGSPTATEVIRRSADARFRGALAEWLGPPDAAVRGRMLSATMLGMAVSRELSGGFGLDEDETEKLCARLAETLQALVDG